MFVHMSFGEHEVELTLQKNDDRIAIDDFAIKLKDRQVKLRAMKRHLVDFNFFHQFKLECIDFFEVRIR